MPVCLFAVQCEFTLCTLLHLIAAASTLGRSSGISCRKYKTNRMRKLLIFTGKRNRDGDSELGVSRGRSVRPGAGTCSQQTRRIDRLHHVRADTTQQADRLQGCEYAEDILGKVQS